jgi:hypothetical protein
MVRSCFGPVTPLANHRAQLVGLFLQLPHSLRLHGEIATDFLDLAFDDIIQFDAWVAPTACPRRAAYDSGLPHCIPSTTRS